MNRETASSGGGRRSGGGFGGIWLITFTDLTALMLTFFVMQFAMSEVEEEKWRTATTALGHEFNMPAHLESPGQGDELMVDAINPPPALALDYLAAVLSAEIAGNPQLTGASIDTQADRLVVSLPNDLLFAAGEATLHAEAEAALFMLGGALAGVRNRVDVVGHTDPAPPATQRFTSNWELSLSRAAAVAAALRAAGYTRPLGIYGRAGGQFALLDPALPLAQRQVLAQRVDIVIREDGGHP